MHAQYFASATVAQAFPLITIALAVPRHPTRWIEGDHGPGFAACGAARALNGKSAALPPAVEPSEPPWDLRLSGGRLGSARRYRPAIVPPSHCPRHQWCRCRRERRGRCPSRISKIRLLSLRRLYVGRVHKLVSLAGPIPRQCRAYARTGYSISG
jgi:hypothetical protein